jgi:hypothetical protein
VGLLFDSIIALLSLHLCSAVYRMFYTPSATCLPDHEVETVVLCPVFALSCYAVRPFLVGAFPPPLSAAPCRPMIDTGARCIFAPRFCPDGGPLCAPRPSAAPDRQDRLSLSEGSTTLRQSRALVVQLHYYEYKLTKCTGGGAIFVIAMQTV